MLSLVEHEKSFITSGPDISTSENLGARLWWASEQWRIHN